MFLEPVQCALRLSEEQTNDLRGRKFQLVISTFIQLAFEERLSAWSQNPDLSMMMNDSNELYVEEASKYIPTDSNVVGFSPKLNRDETDSIPR